METITRQKARAIQEAIQNRLRDLEQAVGVKIEVGTISWTDTSCRVILNGTTAVTGADRVVEAKKDWERFCTRFGFKREEFGRMVTFGNSMYKIEGITNRGTVKLEMGGRIYRASHAKVAMALAESTVRMVGLRTEATIMPEIVATYTQLSPENLTCDGELRGSVVTRKFRELNARLQKLQKELGREVSETEAFEWYRTHRVEAKDPMDMGAEVIV